MSRTTSRWDLEDIEVSNSSRGAALRVVERTTRDMDEARNLWETAIRLAHANGASLRDIAAVACVSPKTTANLCRP